MTGSCEKCGAGSGPYSLCQTHRVAARNGDDPQTDGGHQLDGSHPVECTECGREYDRSDHDTCPDCECRRRRYIGPIGGDSDGFSTAELRDGETRDESAHARRNAEMLRMADRVLGDEDGDRDE